MNAEPFAHLNRHIEATIPLARAAGVRVAPAADGTVIARAPLAINGNPHGSVFGGSLYVTALVAGYVQTVVMLEDTGIDATVVIRRAQADYRQPLHSDITARAQAVGDKARKHFIDAVRRHGRGRIDLTVCIADGRIPVLDLYARFAAVTPQHGATAAAETR